MCRTEHVYVYIHDGCHCNPTIPRCCSSSSTELIQVNYQHTSATCWEEVSSSSTELIQVNYKHTSATCWEEVSSSSTELQFFSIVLLPVSTLTSRSQNR